MLLPIAFVRPLSHSCTAVIVFALLFLNSQTCSLSSDTPSAFDRHESATATLDRVRLNSRGDRRMCQTTTERGGPLRILRLRGAGRDYEKETAEAIEEWMEDEDVQLPAADEHNGTNTDNTGDEDHAWLGSSGSDVELSQGGGEEDANVVLGNDGRAYNISGYEHEFPGAGHLGSLIKAFHTFVEDEPESIDSCPFALLRAPLPPTSALNSTFVYASRLFCKAACVDLETLLGTTWFSLYHTASDLHHSHWNLLNVQPPEVAVANRWTPPWDSNRQVVCHAEPVLFRTAANDEVQLIAVALADVTGIPEGSVIPTKEELEMGDGIQGGFEFTEENGVQRTLHNTFRLLEQAVFNLRSFVADAVVDTFPIYKNLTTSVNLQARFDRKYEEIKGPEPDWENLRFDDPSDDLEKETKEDVDRYCDEFGEWYREYHQWCLDELAERRKRKPQEDTCEAPPTMRGRQSLEVARQMLGQVREDDPEWTNPDGIGDVTDLQQRLHEEIRRLPDGLQ